MTQNSYQICTRCIMDTSDPEITFDSQGVCSHCQTFDATAAPTLNLAGTTKGNQQLKATVDQIKAEGKGKEYDCVIGISGGIDSSYLAYKVKEFGLRPLAVHCDTGWNSELAVSNIENIVKKLDMDLYTFVVNWDEMRDLQLAFFRASLANCDIPQDHAFLAVLHHLAASHGIKNIISGGNLATESILPSSWGYNAGDRRHLQAVQKQFGTMRLKQYPTLSFFQRYLLYPFVKKIRTVRLLNNMPYNKQEAKQLIQEEFGWRDYGGKHYESIFTRFFQAYYLPHKFGYDKRRAHLSSLIVSRQMERESSLDEMKRPPHPEKELLEDKAFVAKKLGISDEAFDQIIAQPNRTYSDYPSNAWLFDFKTRMVNRFKHFGLVSRNAQ